MKKLEIKITNWDKYNPRKDRANFTWFRMSNDFFAHRDCFGLKNNEKLLYILLLCEASRENSKTIEIRSDFIEQMLSVSELENKEMLEQLEISDLIECVEIEPANQKPRHDGEVTSSRNQLSKNGCLRTNERKKERDERKKERTGRSVSASGVKDPAPLIGIWNSQMGSPFPKIKSCSLKSKRGKAIAARWKERPDEKYWVEVFDKVKASNFLSGRNDRGWIADLEFICRPDKSEEILEGKYDTRAQGSAQSNHFRDQLERISRGEL